MSYIPKIIASYDDLLAANERENFTDMAYNRETDEGWAMVEISNIIHSKSFITLRDIRLFTLSSDYSGQNSILRSTLDELEVEYALDV